MINISFSGGLSSAISAFIAYENNLEFRLIFADTLIEDEDLYRFINEVSKAVDSKIIWLKDGRNPWEVFIHKRWIGNSRVAPCSSVLKTKQIKDWLKENSDISEPLVLGMDWSESDRLERAQKVWSPRPIISLLNDYKVSRPEYEKYLIKYGIKKPRLYDQGFPHNNCGGFCVRSGLKQFATLLETMPERYKFHEEQMEQAMEKIGDTAKPFLQKTTDKKKSYLTLKEFRELYEKGEIKVEPFDYGGCGCFVDD